MKQSWKITYYKPNRQGVRILPGCIRFAVDISNSKDVGLILYTPEKETLRFPFSSEGCRGTLYGIQVEGKGVAQCSYNFYQGNEIITDPYAKIVHGLEKWGDTNKGIARNTSGGICDDTFDWQNDKNPALPYEDSIFYGLNVRAFTMHKSSGVKNRGTFEGIVEKIPYLQKLGITTLELMPCYEYEECLHQNKTHTSSMQEAAKAYRDRENTIRLNCWGFQKGFYFAPKFSYSAIGNPVNSFKTLVRELHKHGLEVILQFYFPPDIRQLYMLEVLKYWVNEYHVDGFRICGFHIPYRMLFEEPSLRKTKLWFEYWPSDAIDGMEDVHSKNIAVDNKGYREDGRRFLKGDEGFINQILHYQRVNPKEYGVVNYIADYDGFSLYDYVTYERKHNESNGEDNQDGTDLNYSWNCGTEGDTRRKGIQFLRLKQIKNALSLVLLSQGIPFIFSGDEFGNTRFGNNNAYCQDNDTGWIKWRQNQFTEEILAYTQFLIQLRKAHRILHMPEELQIMDSKSCGYPDISYHGLEAWRPDLSHMSRLAGIVLCGQYAPDKEDTSFYIACNMHWEDHELALPKLPAGTAWSKISDTSDSISIMNEKMEQENTSSEKEDSVVILARSIAIYQSVTKTPEAKKKKTPVKRK